MSRETIEELSVILEGIYNEGRITFAEYQKILLTAARGLKEVK